jgi:hypothetical protein
MRPVAEHDTQHAELLELSDCRGLRDLTDARDRVRAVADVFVAHADPGGCFPLIYGIGLGRVVEELERDSFRDPLWVRAFDLAFARRYLDGLSRHLRGEPSSPAWRATYQRAGAGLTSALAAALTAHLIADLPHSVAEANTRAWHAWDFDALSRLIWGTAANSIAAVERHYPARLPVAASAGRLTWPFDATAEQLFLATTRTAFAHGLALGNPVTRTWTRAQIAATQSMLDTMTMGLPDRSPGAVAPR